MGSSDDGAAYVFKHDGTSWSNPVQLQAGGTDAEFGFDVAIDDDGDRIVVGAPNAGANNEGRAYVFTPSGSSWVQQAELSDTERDANDEFGWSVAIYGDHVLVGASFDDGSGAAGAREGTVHAFEFDSPSWDEAEEILACNTDTDNRLGLDVALSKVGTQIVGVAGSMDDAGAQDAGAAYVYRLEGSSWLPGVARLSASTDDAFARFGESVAADGNSSSRVLDFTVPSQTQLAACRSSMTPSSHVSATLTSITTSASRTCS